MTRDQAINYLFSTGMSEEQVNTIVEALSSGAEYENELDVEIEL